MKTPRTAKKQPKKVVLGVQLFTLAYDPATTAVTFQTDIPIPKVMELVQIIMLGQQRAQARQEVMAEVAAKEKETKTEKK